MPHRLAVLCLVVVVLIAGCSGDDDSSATSTTADAAPTTTDAGTTLDPDATTTSDPTASPSTTQAMMSLDGAPTTALDSFTATSAIDVDIGGDPISVVTEGIRVGEDFQCTSTIDAAGMTLVNTAVVTLDGVWLDDGEGFRETEMIAVEDIVSSCPVHPVFWADFDTSEFPTDLTGTSEEFNGVPAQHIDLSENIALATGMGLADDLAGADFERMSIWLADDGRWVVGMLVDATLDAEAVSRAFGGLPTQSETPATLTMDIQVDDVNDPTLSIDVPTD